MAKQKQTTKVDKATNEQYEKVKIITDQINQQYGKGTFQNLAGTPLMHNFDFQVPSGSLRFDTILGPVRKMPSGVWMHGLAPGRIYEFFGPNGCGKTTSMKQIIANGQSLGLRCAAIDMEHAWDPIYARKLGVKLEHLDFTQPSCGEEALDIVEKLVRGRVHNVIIIDSIAALVPQAEVDKEMAEDTMGALPRLLSKAMRKIKPAMHDHCMLVFTNQIRFKVGRAAMYGNPEVTPGGEAMKFFADTRVDLRPGEKVIYNGVVVGHRVKIKTIKNKIAAPFQEAEVSLIYGAGYDFHDELVTMAAEQQRILKQEGSWYTLDGYGKLQGRDAVINAMREVVGTPYRLYNDTLTAINAGRGFTPEGERIAGWTVPESNSPVGEVCRPEPEATITPTTNE